MKFDIPRNELFTVEEADIRLEPDEHPYQHAHIDEIERNWAKEREANPHLFDGWMVLCSSLSYDGRKLAGRCHPIRFATYLHWRRHRADDSAENVFAQAMPVSSDNALVAIRMAGHTANAGRVYFAAGSLEPEDVSGGRADFDRNMRRELSEETGIELDGVPRDPGYHAVCVETGLVLVRRYFLPEAAQEIATRIRHFAAADERPEIDGPVIIADAGHAPAQLAPHMPPLIAWHFSDEANAATRA